MPTAKRESILAAIATRTGASRAPFPVIAAGAATYTLLADGEESVREYEYDDAIVTMAIAVHRATPATTDASHATDASALLAAIITETLGPDLTIGGLCDSIRYDSGVTDYPEGSALVAATATFSIDYRHIAGSPY